MKKESLVTLSRAKGIIGTRGFQGTSDQKASKDEPILSLAYVKGT
jgi:hypothetical protein